jgi:hypothetical protein
MGDVSQTGQTPRVSDDAGLLALARETRTPVEVVRTFYDQELAGLESEATVKNFIQIIAGRRVKERLRRSKLRPQ